MSREPSAMNTEVPRPRWKLLIVLLAVPWLAVLALQQLPQLERWQFAGTFAGVAAVFASLLAALVWLLGPSRLPGRARRRGLLAVLVLVAVAAAMVRKDGHMGDFLPQLAWRWQAKPGSTVGRLVIPPEATAGVRFTTDQPDDAPKFLGAGGTNDVRQPAVAGAWRPEMVRELWRRPVGLGWSGFIVAGDCAITQEQRGDEEIIVAYHKLTGAPLWQHAERARFEEAMGGDGPRATPTAHGAHVFALGATGILLCLDGASGRLIWRRDTLAEAGHANLTWAKSCNPLVVGDKVVVTLGDGPQALAAYDAATGKPAWRSGPGKASYASPVLAQTASGPRILTVFADRVTAVDPADGRETWAWVEGFKGAPANVANPVLTAPDRVLVGIGYGVGSTLLKVADGQKPEILWHSLKMKPKFTNFVVRADRGVAWALDEGRLSCLDLADGSQRWRGASYGHGQVTGWGDRLVIQSERGEVVVVAASDKEEEVIAQLPALTSKTWNQPCLAGRLLLVRNDREAVCFELAPAVP